MEFTVAFYVCIALLGAVLLAGVHKRPANDMAFFDRVSVKEIQGAIALFIMLHTSTAKTWDSSTITASWPLPSSSSVRDSDS